MESEIKHCPYCDEVIRAKAVKCKHCGAMLDDSVRPSSPADFASDAGASPESRPSIPEPDLLSGAERKDRAKAFMLERRYEEAESEIRKAMELDPADDSLQKLLDEVDSLIQEKHIMNARAFTKDHRLEDAIFEYGEALKRNPRNDEAEDGLAEARSTLERIGRHLVKGDEYRDRKKYEKAVKEYQRVMKLNPTHFYAKSQIEQCCRIIIMQGSLVAKASETLKNAENEYKRKKYREVISETQRVLEKLPDHPDALRLLRKSRNEIRKRKRMLTVAVIVVVCGAYFSILHGFWKSSKYEGYMTKAHAARENKDWASVIDHCNEALAYKPDDETALELISDSVERLQKEAERAAKKMHRAKTGAEKAKAGTFALTLYESAMEDERRADSDFDSERYVSAKTYYETAMEQYERAENASLAAMKELEHIQITKKVQQGKEADRLKTEALKAKAQAEDEHAHKYILKAFELGQQKLEDGNDAYRSLDYGAAAERYEEAAGLFQQSAEHARKGLFLPAGLEMRDGRIISLSDNAEMVLIPAGSFMAGSPEGEGFGNEQPQHRVTLDAFYMDKYEVTVERYDMFLRATGHNSPPQWISEYSPGNGHPIVGVSWEDAAAYAEWAGKRLPTEAEWEYACRAMTTTEYNVGDGITHDDSNYSLREGKDRWDKGTAPVGSFAPNAWGLCDMHGNVWEWCLDWYDRNFYRQCPPDNPKCVTDGLERVVRGGSWKNSEYALRSANRGFYRPADVYNHVGFRCASR